MTKESMDDVKTTNQEPEFNQANRYILIGIERSKEEVDKTSKKVYDPSSNRKVYPKKLIHDKEHDVVRIAVANEIEDNKVKTFDIRLEDLRDQEGFKAKYGSPLEYIESTREYGTINNPKFDYLYDYQPMVVINRIENIGVQCADINGNLFNIKKETAYEYNRAHGIVNMNFMKRKEPDGTMSIAMTIRGRFMIPKISSEGIIWSDDEQSSQSNRFSLLSMVDIFDTLEDKRRPMGSRQNLEHYMQKLEVMCDDWFDVEIDTMTLIRYKDKLNVIEVPPVKRIQAGAFENVEADEVIIPDTVSIIDHMAFDHASIKKLTIGDGIGFIGGDLGLRWDKLKTLNLGKNVHGIERWINIGPNEALEYINVSKDNPYYTSINGVLYDKEVTRLIHYPKHRRNSEYIMPNTVTFMMSLSHREAGALAYLHNLKTIRLSDGLTELPAGTFHDCKKLTKVDLGNGIEVIDEPEVFTGCENLEQVNGGTGLVTMDYKAFGEPILSTKEIELAGDPEKRTLRFEIRNKQDD